MDNTYKDCLIYDIECATKYKKADSNTDILKIFGAYSFKTDKYYYLTKPEKIKELINNHRYLIGFNNYKYDNHVLYNNGFDKADGDFKGMYKSKMGEYNFIDKINIDLRSVFKKRAGAIKIKKGYLNHLLMEYSLDYIANVIGLSEKKIHNFDYSIFNKDEWTSEEIDRIIAYTKQDLIVTKEMFIWVEEYFSAFKEFMRFSDIDKKRYLTTSTATLVYIILCNQLGLKEEYSEDTYKLDKYAGAWVSYPSGEHFTGKIRIRDFSSLYPSVMHQANIYSPVKDNNGWNGGDLFKTVGVYNNKEQGKIERLLKKWYEDRKVYKKLKDPREYCLKICLNTCFSEDTSILTSTGIKNIKECNIGDMVYSLNRITGETELKPIIATQQLPYDGKMIHFKKRNIDLIVTPDHNMVYEHNKKISLISAENMLQKTYGGVPKIKKYNGIKDEYFSFLPYIKDSKLFIKLDCPYSQRKNNNLKYIRHKRMHQSLTGYDPSLKGKWFFRYTPRDMYIPLFVPLKDFLYFIGIYLSEGSSRVVPYKKYNNTTRGISHTISISQYKLKNNGIYNKIDNTLNNLQFRYHKNDKMFYISSKFLYTFLEMNKSYDKYIPDWVWKYDATLLQFLHDGLYDGDGNKSRYRYNTNSYKLKDDIIKLNFLLGYRVTVHTEQYTTKKDIVRNIYRITRTGRGLVCRTNHKNGEYIKNPSDIVYCVTVQDNHTLFAGRNDKMIWCGQCYGIAGKATFKHFFNKISASDITALGRQFIKYARKRYTEEGYNVFYSDTDSLYMEDPFGDDIKYEQIAKDIVANIKSSLPFPYEQFELAHEKNATDVWFFKGKNKKVNVDLDMEPRDYIDKEKGFLKKNYIYRDEDGNITVKNLGVMKKSLTKLSRTIFWNDVVPKISSERKVKFPKTYFDSLINKYLLEDITLMSKRFTCNPPETYANSSNLNSQIASAFGAGIHFLIPVNRDVYENNKVISIGKAKKFILLDDFKRLNMGIKDIDVRGVWKELGYFIEDEYRMESLSKWF